MSANDNRRHLIRSLLIIGLLTVLFFLLLLHLDSSYHSLCVFVYDDEHETCIYNAHKHTYTHIYTYT